MAKGMSFKVLLELQAKEFQKGINSIKKQLEGFGRFVKNAFALGSVTMFGKQMVQVGKDFEDAMARVQAVSNATTNEFKKMQAEAQKMGSTTRYTATEAANALENLTRNGMSAANATKALSSVLQLAQANSIGLADAANILTNTLNMFNLGAGQASRVNDVLSSTASHAATDITSLYEAMTNAAPAANVLGFSIEEVSAVIGALAQRGVKGAEAGTKLRVAFQKMANPKVVAKMKEQGIEIDETTMRAEGLLKTVKKLAKADLSLGKLGEIFDAESAMAVQMLTASLGDLETMLEVTANSAGETERMFNQSVGSVQKELDSLKSMYEGLLISISQKTSGAVKSIVRLLQNLIINFETVGGTIMNIASVAVPLFASRVVQLASTIRTAMQSAAAGVATLKAAMGGVISLVTTLVTWVGTALVGAWNRANKEIKDARKQMDDAAINAHNLQESIEKINEKIGDGSNKASLTSALKEATRLLPEFASAINNAKKIAEKTGEWEKLKNVLQDIADLQSLVTTRDAKKAIVAAQSSKIGQNMWYESQWYQGTTRGLLTGPEDADKLTTSESVTWIAREIRQSLKKSGFEKDAQKQIFNEIAKLITISETFEEGVDQAIKLLRDYNVGVEDEFIKAWLNTYNPNLESRAFSKTKVKRGRVSVANQTNSEIERLNSTIIANSYKILKEDFENIEKNTRDELGDISKHQDEYNAKMYEAAQNFFNKAIDLGLDPDGSMMKEVMDIVAKYPKPIVKEEPGEGESKTPKETKTPTDFVKDAIDDYNEGVSKLNNRLTAGTITAKDYEKELDNLEDKTWEAITAFSDFEEILKKLGQTALGTDLQSKYSQNRTDENVQKIATQYGALGAYSVPKEPERNTRTDYAKTDNQKLEETVRLKFEYAEGIDNLITKLEDAINDGDFDLVKDDAIDMLDNLKTKAQEATEEAQNLEAKLNLSEAVTKLDEQIQSLSVTTFNTFNTMADVMDRVSSSLISIAEVFDEDLRDSPFFKAYQAFNTIMNSSIQIMEAVMSAIELKKQLENKAALEKVKNAALEVAANKAATASEVEKAAASAGAAAAGGASSVASIPYVGPALAVAAVASITAAIMAAMSKFANGGIVGGNSYTGDKVLARLNSGELVLNRQQQATLFNAIKSGNLGGGGQVTFKIRGTELLGVLNNEMSRRRG